MLKALLFTYSLLSIVIYFNCNGIGDLVREDEVENVITKWDENNLHLYIGLPVPVSGTLHCDAFKQNDFTGDPDWTNDDDNTYDAELTEFSGIREISINIPYSEVIDDKVYLRTFLDQNSNRVPDGSELCEYYGNLSQADLSSGRKSIRIEYYGSAEADVILDKRFNDIAIPAPTGLEVNAFYTNGTVGLYLICLVFKGSESDTYKDKDWISDPVQIQYEQDVTQLSITDIANETEIYFLVEQQASEDYGAPSAGMYFEYYNNKNVTDSQGNKCNTIPVNSSIDIVLGNILGG